MCVEGGATETQIAAVRSKLETVGVHVVVMPGELTTAIGALGDPEGVRELGLWDAEDGVVLARTPELITIAEVLAAIREPAHNAADLDIADGPAVDALRRRDAAVDQALAGLTLGSVATTDPTTEAVVAKLSAYRRR